MAVWNSISFAKRNDYVVFCMESDCLVQVDINIDMDIDIVMDMDIDNDVDIDVVKDCTHIK